MKIKTCSSKGHNYKIHDNGTLEFMSVDKNDEASYWCKAKNMYGLSNSDEVEVIVESPAKIREAPDNIHVNQGEKLELQCAATGDPAPIISWLRNGHQVLSNCQFFNFSSWIVCGLGAV